ncbi:MAG: cell division protein FtsK [Alphaproteobacteria bacterium]|nr:cell division protein FtsK [Alphaproteobacteria bacterium]
MARGSAPTGKFNFLPPAAREFLRLRALETAGTGLLAVAVAAAVALASYSPDDPSPNLATGRPVENLLGAPGAAMADILLRTLGLAATGLIGTLAAWGWQSMTHHPPRRLAWSISLLPFALILLAAGLAGLEAPGTWLPREGLGGVLGMLLLAKLTQLAALAEIPAAASALAAALTGIVLLACAAGFRPQRMGRFLSDMAAIGRFCWRAGAWTARLIRRAGSARPERHGPGLTRFEPHLESAVETDFAARLAREPEPGDLVAPRAERRSPRPATQGKLDFARQGVFRLPPVDFLTMNRRANQGETVDEAALAQNARLLESVLDDFGVRGEIVKVRPGPVVTLYELEPAPGTKSSRVVGLADDIARYMSAVSVRIAVVPGRNVIGIELPNARRETVYLRELLTADAYGSSTQRLALVLGKDIGGAPVIADLERMPHLLIAGTTGSGKSVAINTMILSFLYRLTPEQCRFIMVDPKMLELSVYDGIPHLLAPVVTDPRKAIVALKWVVREMENRYRAMSTLGVRNIAGYNTRLDEAARKGETLRRRVQTGFDPATGGPLFEEQPLDMTRLPYIVVIVDEMADLMMVAGKDIEAAIQRLAQMARAAGIHLIMATQRPSVDVITGTIKANFPTRVSFQVTSKIDSRTILGEGGAEQLLGQGDMLYMAGGGRITRVHGPFVSEAEVESVVTWLKRQGQPDYLDAVTEELDEGDALHGPAGGDGGDELYDQAVALVAREGKATTSFIQRHFQIGYNRAARIIERMEAEGVVGGANHVGKREVLIGQHGG